MNLLPRFKRRFKRSDIEKHSLDLRQFIDFRESRLPNGMRIIEAHSTTGLTFTLLPDRGMDIWSAHYKGIPLTWISPASPHPPDSGQTWLEQYNGGLLTTCGLTHVGPPETDSETGEKRDIHGKYTRMRAQDIGSECYWIDYGDDEIIEMSLNATIYQSSLFGVQLKLDRTIWIDLESPDIGISDTVTNIGDAAAPFMLLYHINLGFPLIRDGTKLITSSDKVYPRDAEARAGFDTWETYSAATPQYAEQVFFHHLNTSSGEVPQTHVMLLNETDNFGLDFMWETDTLPYMTQWKNTRQGIYVSGIEPGNCIPEGRNAARDNGRLQMLEAGETVRTYLRLTVLDGEASIAGHREAIETLRTQGQPIKGCDLSGYK